MLIFNNLLGNLLKEVKRNNMLITLELKKKSASFQILPTLPPQKFTNFPRPVLVIACVAGVERGRGRGNLGARESVWGARGGKRNPVRLCQIFFSCDKTVKYIFPEGGNENGIEFKN